MKFARPILLQYSITPLILFFGRRLIRRHSYLHSAEGLRLGWGGQSGTG